MQSLSKSQQRMVSDHLWLARRVAASFDRRSSSSFDDLLGAALLGLVESAIRYEPTRCSSFSTFARKRVRGAVLDELRRARAASRCRSTGELSESSEYRSGQMAVVASDLVPDHAPTPAEIVARRELAGEVRTAVARLPEREGKILEMLFRDDCTLAEVAAALGVSNARVCQLRSRALRRTRGSICRQRKRCRDAKKS